MTNDTAPRGRRRWLWPVIILLAITAGVIAWCENDRPYHFCAVNEGVLYRSGALTPYKLSRVVDEHGIKTVVSLVGPGVTELDRRDWTLEGEKKVSADRGILHLDLNTPPGTPFKQEQIDQWIALFEDPERLPVIVHCNHGVVRTNMLVAVYELEFRPELYTSNRDLLEKLEMWGHDLWDDRQKPWRDFILNYQPRKKAGDAEPGEPE